MSRKDKKNTGYVVREEVKNSPKLVYRMVPRVIPIAAPASHIQLTPIVQPIALVPYSTQSQPMNMVDDNYGGYEGEYDEYDD